MKTLLSFIAVTLFAAMISQSQAETSNDKSPYTIRFGIVKMRVDETHYISKETDTIPLKIGEHILKFGYEITTDSKTPYVLHYVLHLPRPPKVISDELATSNAGVPTATVTSPKRDIWDKSFVDYLWFDPGDPEGPHSIDIYVNGVLIKTVRFKVIGV